jgi:hypothetical protein
MLPVAFKRPFSIHEIVENWASELPNTSVLELQNLLLLAIVKREIKTVVSPSDMEILKEQAEVAMSLGENSPSSMGVIALELHKVTRDEFFRWIDEQGYQRPTFWDSGKTTEQELPLAPQNHRAPRKAPERERVKKLMRADIEAGNVTIEELLRDKIAWAAKYNTRPTTARDAAKELVAELK